MILGIVFQSFVSYHISYHTHLHSLMIFFSWWFCSY